MLRLGRNRTKTPDLLSAGKSQIVGKRTIEGPEREKKEI